MLGAFARAARQFDDPALWAVVIKTALAALLLFAAVYAGAFWLLSQVSWSQMPGIGPFLSWLGGMADIFAAALWVAAGAFTLWLLFPPLTVAVAGLFSDQVCAAVEARHYPQFGPPREIAALTVLAASGRFFLLSLAINLVALPFYLLSIWIAGLGLALYYLINGYLLGREYFMTIADRRLPPDRAQPLYQAHRGRIMLAGCVIAFGMSIPLLNLLTPPLATAAMLHLVAGLARRDGIILQGGVAPEPQDDGLRGETE